MPAAPIDVSPRRWSRRVIEDCTQKVGEVLTLLEESELSVDDVDSTHLRRLVALLEVARARVETACFLGGLSDKAFSCPPALKTVTEDEEEENRTIGGFTMDDDEDSLVDDGTDEKKVSLDNEKIIREDNVYVSDEEEKGKDKKNDKCIKKKEEKEEDEEDDGRLLSMRTLSTILDEDKEKPASRRRKLSAHSISQDNIVSPLHDPFRKGNKRSSKLKASENAHKAKRRRAPIDETEDCKDADDLEEFKSKQIILEEEILSLPPSTLVLSSKNSTSQTDKNDFLPSPSLGHLGQLPPEVLLALVAILNARELGRLQCSCRAARGSPGIVDLAVLRLKRFQYGVKILPILTRDTWPKVLQRWEWTRSSRSLTTRMDGVVAILRTTSIASNFQHIQTMPSRPLALPHSQPPWGTGLFNTQPQPFVHDNNDDDPVL